MVFLPLNCEPTYTSDYVLLPTFTNWNSISFSPLCHDSGFLETVNVRVRILHLVVSSSSLLTLLLVLSSYGVIRFSFVIKLGYDSSCHFVHDWSILLGRILYSPKSRNSKSPMFGIKRRKDSFSPYCINYHLTSSSMSLFSLNDEVYLSIEIQVYLK